MENLLIFIIDFFTAIPSPPLTRCEENLIGEGGYSEVYKGHLENGQLVAIKRLTRGTPEEMTADFLSELGILVHVNHPNIANVIGYGVEGGMHLVLHLSPHGSLASLLTGFSPLHLVFFENIFLRISLGATFFPCSYLFLFLQVLRRNWNGK